MAGFVTPPQTRYLVRQLKAGAIQRFEDGLLVPANHSGGYWHSKEGNRE